MTNKSNFHIAITIYCIIANSMTLYILIKNIVLLQYNTIKACLLLQMPQG